MQGLDSLHSSVSHLEPGPEVTMFTAQCDIQTAFCHMGPFLFSFKRVSEVDMLNGALFG